MTFRRFALALLFCGALLQPALAVSAAQLDWTTPVSIGQDLPSSWFPDLNADRDGSVRVVWSANLEDGDGNTTHDISGAVMLAELRDGKWTAPADLAVMDAGIASRPFIVSDGAWAHLIYRTSLGYGSVKLVYRRAPLGADLSNAHSWSAPLPLTNDETYWASLLVLPDNTLVVAYNQERSAPEGGRRPALYVRRSTDGGLTWSFPVQVSDGGGRVARVSLAASADGHTLIAAWDEGYDNLQGLGDPTGVATAVSHDGGATWSPEQLFTQDAEQSTVATNDVISVLVYRAIESDKLLYRTSSDGGSTWSEARAVPAANARAYTDKHNFDKLSLAFDGDGRLLLAYVGANPEAPNGLSVMVSAYLDGEWGEPDIVASPQGFPEYPRISVALGNRLNIVYFVRDQEFDIGHYTLWWSSAVSTARPVAPANVQPAQLVVAPTPTPVVIRVTPYPETPRAPQPLPPASAGAVDPQAVGAIPIHRALLLTLVALLAVALAGWAVMRLRIARF